ncbi:hypothetical protein DIPPA_11887 [Diplonema papillatum]|nr:hypothetical protein DIPPA_11887 [Diplonema papillatum]
MLQQLTICRCPESAAKRRKRGPSPPGTPEATPKSRRRLRPSAQSATREAADAGANTAIENAAEGDDTRTAAATKGLAIIEDRDVHSAAAEVQDKVKRGSTKR